MPKYSISIEMYAGGTMFHEQDHPSEQVETIIEAELQDFLNDYWHVDSLDDCRVDIKVHVLKEGDPEPLKVLE